MSPLPGFNAIFNTFEVLGCDTATTVSGTTAAVTLTISADSTNKVYIFAIYAFYDGNTQGVVTVQDASGNKLGYGVCDNYDCVPIIFSKPYIASENISVVVPAGGVGQKSYVTAFTKNDAPPTTIGRLS